MWFTMRWFQLTKRNRDNKKTWQNLHKEHFGWKTYVTNFGIFTIVPFRMLGFCKWFYAASLMISWKGRQRVCREDWKIKWYYWCPIKHLMMPIVLLRCTSFSILLLTSLISHCQISQVGFKNKFGVKWTQFIYTCKNRTRYECFCETFVKTHIKIPRHKGNSWKILTIKESVHHNLFWDKVTYSGTAPNDTPFS